MKFPKMSDIFVEKKVPRGEFRKVRRAVAGKPGVKDPDALAASVKNKMKSESTLFEVVSADAEFSTKVEDLLNRLPLIKAEFDYRDLIRFLVAVDEFIKDITKHAGADAKLTADKHAAVADSVKKFHDFLLSLQSLAEKTAPESTEDQAGSPVDSKGGLFKR